MNDPLYALRVDLKRTFRLDASVGWSKPEAMSRQLALLHGHFESSLVPGTTESVAEAVLRYRKTGCLPSHRDIKHACIGASMNLDGWRLMDDSSLLVRLLNAAQLGTDRIRLKYFQCLLRSYWSFPKNREPVSQRSLDGWGVMRKWLTEQRVRLASARGAKPRWFETLTDHENLLTADPCARYARESQSDANDAVDKLLDILDVPVDSWLREDLVYAKVQASMNQNERDFKASINRLVAVASGRGRMRPSEAISRRCLALLVSRYAACSSHSEVASLLDAVISFLGNPWLNRRDWDNCVLDSHGDPNLGARVMVESWLKVRLMKDFFTLFSEDLNVDARRLRYWSKFEPVIDDLWFGLGPNAVDCDKDEVKRCRHLASARTLTLNGADPTTKALLMRVGEFVIVEFGGSDNACFVYAYRHLSAVLNRALNSRIKVGIELDNLKANNYELRLHHVGAWESYFDTEISALIGSLPSKSENSTRRSANFPMRHRFDALVAKFVLQVEDLSKQGGCLWVRTDTSNPLVSEPLQTWGFIYDSGKGWWRYNPWPNASSNRMPPARQNSPRKVHPIG
jgi:hypothetical protein